MAKKKSLQQLFEELEAIARRALAEPIAVKPKQIWQYKKNLYQVQSVSHPTGEETEYVVNYCPLSDENLLEVWEVPFWRKLSLFQEKFELKNDVLLFSAITIASNAHQGQVDKAGEDYFKHLLRVKNSADDFEKKDCCCLA